MTKALSARQERLLEYIRAFMTERGYPPTVRDIVQGCKVSSTSVVDYNLKLLAKAGYIRRTPDISRGIELIGAETCRRPTVPLAGTIAAGRPIPVPDEESWNPANTAERVEVSPSLIGNRQRVYALKVKGNSMIDALINDGDIVLMESAESVENGQMAAVWLKNDKEATLKKFYAEPTRVRLQPANAAMKPFFYKPDEVAVQGKVIAVIRQLG